MIQRYEDVAAQGERVYCFRVLFCIKISFRPCDHQDRLQPCGKNFECVTCPNSKAHVLR